VWLCSCIEIACFLSHLLFGVKVDFHALATVQRINWLFQAVSIFRRAIPAIR